MKKVLAILLVVVTLLCVAACGDNNDNTPTTTTTTTNQTTTTVHNDTTKTVTDGTTTTVNSESTTTAAGGIGSTTVQGSNESTTVKNDSTTTTTKNPTTTTTKADPDVSTEDIINKPVTKSIYMYDVNPQTFEVGAKFERRITYKGTIKIGNTAASTGAFAGVGLPFNAGIEAYINKINFNGGIGGDYNNDKKGYYIEFVHYDDGFDSYTGYAYTKKLVEEDKVFALVGHFGSPTVGATIDYIKETGVIACYMACGLEALYNSSATTVDEGSTIFPVQPIYATEGRIIVGRIVQQYDDAKKIGVIYTNDECGVGIKDGVKAQVAAIGSDYECVVALTTTKAADISAAVERIADCDVVVVASVQSGVVSILKSMIINGVYKPVFTSYSVASAQTLLEIKPLYDTLEDDNKFPIYSNAWLSSTDLDSFFNFGEDVTGYMGSTEMTLSSYTIAGWIAANVFCDGLERVVKSGKEINNLTFVEAMESAKIEVEMTADSKMPSGAKLDYSNGYRLGTTTMGLIKNGPSCSYFEEVDGMKDFIKFIKTGNVAYAQ